MSDQKRANGRLENWKDKLLDISLNNRLIKFRETKKTIQIKADLIELYKRLCDGEELELLHTNEPELSFSHKTKPKKTLLQTPYTQKELNNRSLQIFRAARLSIEETGVNTLYLALGFLHWYESENSDILIKAPILLLPIEIIRGRANMPFKIKCLGDVQINKTLDRRLKYDFGIELQEQNEYNDLHVETYFDEYRKAITANPRWSVEEDSFIGIFSFAKYLMWNDLETNYAELLKSPLVNHIINNYRNPYEDNIPFLPADKLDGLKDIKESFCLTEADSSQQVAIYAAQSGKTFVLQGPPGTGKSQTITNIICQCLATNKTVLFVAEKLAALEVVQRRLERLGMGQFCLEIHKNASKKDHVINQLKTAYNNNMEFSDAERNERASEIKELVGRLNSYRNALHKKRLIGFSVYEAIEKGIDEDNLRIDKINYGDYNSYDKNKYKELKNIVENFCDNVDAIKIHDEHPFVAVRNSDASKEECFDLIEKLIPAIETLEEDRQGLSRILDIPVADTYNFYNTLMELGDLIRVLPEKAPYHKDLVLVTDNNKWNTLYNNHLVQIKTGMEYNKYLNYILSKYDEKFFALNIPYLKEKFSRWSKRFFILSWLMLFRERKLLRTLSLTKSLASNDEVIKDCSTAISVRELEKAIIENENKNSNYLGGLWQGLKTKWKNIYSVLEWCNNFNNILRRLCVDVLKTNPSDLYPVRKQISLHFGNTLSDTAQEILKVANNYQHNFKIVNNLYAEIRRELDFDIEGLDYEFIKKLKSNLHKWRENRHRFDDWMDYLKAVKTLEASGLSFLYKAHRVKNMDRIKLEKYFEKTFFSWWLDETFKRDESLISFRGEKHKKLINKFNDLDKKFYEYNRKYIVSRISQQRDIMPELKSEESVLRREIGKKRRHKPIRRLFNEIPNLIKSLKPCFLMSPLSVAQYLNVSENKFDIIVFDEASQIPPWDAVGALARGKSAVIVGDSKQLPPTSFFQRGEVDEDVEDEYKDDDQVSILDECIASLIPESTLDWHYRSKHETLIAFSNYNYYENKLMTFPSSLISPPFAITDNSGVILKRIPDAFYDRGKSKTNKKEAEELVREIIARIQDPARNTSSMGVVTFNMQQADLIETLIDKERELDSEIEDYFQNPPCPTEPLFIKSIENVQGDERDVMFFSICYAKDQQEGPLPMNFGPLNKRGGEKRLNVAVTRAREELIVFSNLNPADMDLSKTSSEGVKHLKLFLEYAEKGVKALYSENSYSGEKFDSPFEKQVCKYIKHLGFDVHTQVGCSGYRVDLAVVNPSAHGKYLLGVECDGRTYHSGKTARDRDRLRQAVLEKMGWKIYRIWSTDWWNDPKSEAQKLEEAIKAAFKGYR